MTGASLTEDSGPVHIGTLQELQETVADNIPEIMIDLIDTYIEDSGKHLRELVENFQAGNYTGLEIRAHSLKSSSATFGAHGLANKFAQMERLLREGKTGEIRPLLEAAQEEFAAVIDILQAERAKLI